MKPNGRRAWRKWLKSQRKHDKDSWAANIGACLGRAAYARRHRGTDAGQGLPDVVPTVSATPFTARSLVGMTMGERKRLYQRIVDAFPTEGDAFLIDLKAKAFRSVGFCRGASARVRGARSVEGMTTD